MKKLIGVLMGILKAASCAVILGIVWFALVYTCAGSLSLPVRNISTVILLCIVSISISLVFQIKICPRRWMNLILVAVAFGVFMLLIEYRDNMFEQLSSATINFFRNP